MKILAAMTVAMMATSSQVDPLAPLPAAPVQAALPPVTRAQAAPPVSNAALTGFAGYKLRLASLARRQPTGVLSLEASAEPTDLAATPEEAALGRDASTRIRLAISHLPADQQAAITAVVYRGQSIQQAARAARVPEGTLKSRLHRALQNLETALAHLR